MRLLLTTACRRTLQAVVAALCLVAAQAGERLDPKDGPDIDLRVAIEDNEVRFQIVTNLAFMDDQLDVLREIEAELAANEMPESEAALFDLFSEANLVEIDGKAVTPRVGGFEWDPGDPALYPHFVEYGALAVAKTRLTLVYPCETPPKRVRMAWGVWPENNALREADGSAPPIEVMCRLAADGLRQIVRLTHVEPEYTWHRAADGRAHLAEVPTIEEPPPRPFPWPLFLGAAVALGLAAFGPRILRPMTGLASVALVAFGAVQVTSSAAVAAPTGDDARAVFEPLHTNIYRAFDYTADEDVYDALSGSVEGPLLDRLYDEIYRSLVMQEEGGAVSRVEEVRYVEVDVLESGVLATGRPGFRVEVLWEVDGAVYHWDHGHRRTNEYRGTYTVAATEGVWRITDSRIESQRQLDAEALPDLGATAESTAPGDAPAPPKDGEF